MSLRPYGRLWNRQHSFFILLRCVCPWNVFMLCLKNFLNNLKRKQTFSFTRINFLLKESPWLNFLCKLLNFLWISLLLMKQKLINFGWIVNNLIVHNLLINYLKLFKFRVNTEAAAHRCSVAVLKNQKQPLADVLQNRCS